MPGQCYCGDMNSPQAVCFLAMRAIEVHVQVVNFTVTFISAYRVFQRARTVINAVDEMVLQEQRDGARQRRFVHRIQIRFEVQQAESPFKLHHCFQNQQTHGCRPDFPLLQFLQINVFFHNQIFLLR